MGAQKKKAKFVAKGLLNQKIKQRNRRAQQEEPRAAEADAGKKDEADMLDEMDVDDFLNADFLDSENEDEGFEEAADDASDDEPKTKLEKDADDVDDGSSSEEEDESALDPRYLTGTQKAEKECFEAKTVSGLRRLMKIFSDACRSSDAADASKASEITFDVQSSAVYNRLMVNVFRKTHATLADLVALESSSSEEDNAARATCWSTTGQDIQTFVLRELVHYIPFVVPCPKTSRRMLKALLKLWAKSLDANVCMLAFVRIRDLALAVPFPFLELCLKGIYVTYMRNTKFTNEMTLPHHVLMGNCVVELFGLDLSSSYQHAFVYIRELAIAVRKTITSPGPDSFKAVLNWQFFNQLRVWTAVVCAYPAENQLRALVYPLSQLLLAVVRLSSTLRFAPLRFHCVKLLQQLALATNSFIPTSPALLEVLQLEPFRSSYKTSGGKKGGKAAKGSNPTTEVDLELCVKLSKTALDAKRVHDQLIVRLFELLQRECDVYKFNVAFPELAVPLQLTLNKFMHACAVPKWKAQARGLSDSIKKRADWIRSKRSGLELCPKDTAQLDDFLRAEREAAVKKLFEKDASDLQEKLDASAEAVKKDKQEGSSEQAEESKKSKKRKSKKQRGKKLVDEETVAKVKQMSLKEFKKSVAEVDAADEVGDFNFSSDEE
ncbi:Nucleolar complex protein 2-like protein [Phytophthora ramorum]|uniref:Nucleolar complex protein 2-like protein n=1 Tax=Phytophthora ramorum TaxID=164328 RepID=UPI003097D213|nr:Nucleolar complex protein 2-like protein [Phytophthora ramorum]